LASFQPHDIITPGPMRGLTVKSVSMRRVKARHTVHTHTRKVQKDKGRTKVKKSPYHPNKTENELKSVEHSIQMTVTSTFCATLVFTIAMLSLSRSKDLKSR
jgi:hypothetical protein